MYTKSLASGVTATGGQAQVQVAPRGSDEMVVQVEITGTATVDIEGRLNDNLPWVQLNQVTASAIVPLAACPQVRVNVTAYTSGIVNSEVAYR